MKKMIMTNAAIELAKRKALIDLKRVVIKRIHKSPSGVQLYEVKRV
jgi:hypothetical protein